MFESLGLDLKEIIFVIINFLILVGVLGKFLYKPFLGAMENRKKVIQDSFDKAEAVNRRAEAKMSAYNRKISNADEEAREIIKDGKKRAEAQAQLIIEEANAKAGEIIARAEEAAEQERARLVEDMRQEIAGIALMAAEQIVGKEIENVGQEAIIEKVINETGNAKWQN